MFATSARVSVLVIGAVETVDSLGSVFNCVRMNNIHYYSKTLVVCGFNQVFQLFGSAKTRRRGKKVAHVVTKRTVIWVLGNSHYLHSVVAHSLDMR